jgi:hypothetical protein
MNEMAAKIEYSSEASSFSAAGRLLSSSLGIYKIFQQYGLLPTNNSRIILNQNMQWIRLC